MQRSQAPWRRPRTQLAAFGVCGVLLNIVIVYSALAGLSDVVAAHGDVGRIAVAQRHWQDADQAHDAMHADVLQALLTGAAPVAGTGAAVDELTRDVADFRNGLDAVDPAILSGDLAASLRRIRPLQDRYMADVAQLASLAATDPPAARGQLPDLLREFAVLTDQQAAITGAFSAEASRIQLAADADERTARWRITAAAVAALAGLLGLGYLTSRLGRALGVLAARERGVAETLQQSLLPHRLPDLPGIGLAARYVAGGSGAEVGGDWYDVIALPGGEVGLVMGDVVGHDLHAASIMGEMRNALRAYAAEGTAPAAVLQRLNRLSHQQEPSEMATCLYAVLDPVQRTLCIANAGHYPPLLMHDGAGVFLERPAQPPIGAVREVHYVQTVHPLPPQAIVAFYTDGLVERRGQAVQHGMDRLRDVVAGGGAALDQLCDHILTGMLGGQPPTDDVAVLVVAPQALLGAHLDLVWAARPERLLPLRRTVRRWLREAGASDDECFEITVACSEAATNAIEHAYGPGDAQFGVTCDVTDATVTVVVRDWGRWRAPRGRDRGRGLALIRALMDDVDVARADNGTEVRMSRRLRVPAAPVPAAVQR